MTVKHPESQCQNTHGGAKLQKSSDKPKSRLGDLRYEGKKYTPVRRVGS